ncbi:hypothetical protein [Cryobacterium sp. SO1]|uniref:hypothetical protein n=1 Tax=Cryobacterium sp. SO1 TaxID=1897061 RepID=UPI001023E022|nr:hypothetical protein [Cryobacterium sp. SO1]RZI36072.1 hypothetical protein BJQ95_01551 [Cryobacterium sp. SO1]
MTVPAKTVATGTVRLRVVDWADPRAVALRGAMDDEIMPRYATMGVTLIATVDDVPAAHAAHAALRMLGTEYELKRLVTRAEYRGRGLSNPIPIYPPYETIWFSLCSERMLP